ncbi:MAG: ABC transporter substrate-binding protein [Oscillospiraceae bacterium]|nr:ABC transporter substrate-binding protein [Oscillospiraceae bacterium]
MNTLSRRDFLKVLGVGSTATAAALALTACGGNSTGGGSAGGSTGAATATAAPQVNEDASVYEQTQAAGFIAAEVSIASGDPASFLPLKPAGGGKAILNEIYEPLCDQDGPSGELYGVLAKNWYWDGDDFYVELYDSIYDSAKNHLTANDVVWYYKRMQEEGYDDQKYNRYFNDCEVVSEYVAVFHAKPGDAGANVFQADNNLLRGACVVTQAAFEAASDMMATSPVATGRYKLTEYITGLSATIERVSDDEYWQKDLSVVGPQHQANVQKINYFFITEAAQVVNALKTGQIDYASEISSTAAAEFSASSDYTVYRFYSNRMFQTYFNCWADGGCPLADINLRAAICYAINSDDILAAVGGEEFARRLYEFCVPGVQSYNSDCESWDSYYSKCDIDLAKEYLAKSSYNNQVLKIYYYTGEHAEMEEGVALTIGAALDQIGVKYDITPTTDADNLNIPTNANWDLLCTTTGANGNALSLLGKFSTDQYEGGIGNWFDDTLNTMYKEFNTRTGATAETNSKFQQYLIENFYAYGTLEGILIDAWRSSKVANATTKTFRNWTIPGAWVYVE